MDITIFTPTYRGDIDRFLLQRESIERCGIELQHVAVVHHEDLGQFKDTGFQKNLTFISTRDVLSKEIEDRRVRYLQKYKRRLFQRKRLPPMQGWYVQQFVKLAAASVVSTQAILCLDSDSLFLRTVTAKNFFDSATGLPYLYETFDDVDAEMAEWVGRSMRFLGIRPTHQPISRFTHSPTIMRRDVLIDMQRFIENRHKRPWMDAFNPYDMIMEYTTYGVFAKYIDGGARIMLGKPDLSLYFWWPEEVKQLVNTLSERLRTTPARMLAIQSNVGLPVNEYVEILRQFWSASPPSPFE